MWPDAAAILRMATMAAVGGAHRRLRPDLSRRRPATQDHASEKYLQETGFVPCRPVSRPGTFGTLQLAAAVVPRTRMATVRVI